MARLHNLALCLILFATPALAEPGAADRALARLFTDTCLKYPDNPERLRVKLDTSLDQPSEANETFFLGRHQGKVWLDRTQEGNFAVVMRDDGRCIVDGDVAMPEGAMEAFESDATAAGFKLTRTGDMAKADFRGAIGPARTYRLEKDGSVYAAKAAGTTLPVALLHAELTLEPAK